MIKISEMKKQKQHLREQLQAATQMQKDAVEERLHHARQLNELKEVLKQKEMDEVTQRKRLEVMAAGEPSL